MEAALKERETEWMDDDFETGRTCDPLGLLDLETGNDILPDEIEQDGEPDGGYEVPKPAGKPRKSAAKRGKRKTDAMDVGREGEFIAACFLARRGYDILERNWKCKAGEADIIACDEDALVFVEVKSRRDCDKGMPSEAVTKAKRERYERIAACYLATTDVLDVRVRFDIVSILIIPPDRALVRHNIDAFGHDVF